MTENSVFRWDREVPVNWQREVARLAPKTERCSHLAVFWAPGTPEEPVQRWVLHEATPMRFVPPWKREAFLADLPCQCATRWSGAERCSHCQRIISPGRSHILRYLHQTECLALPFWVIQGHTGGHKLRYSQVEQQAARLLKRPDNPPVPGSLPYAELDQRVVRKVRAYDRAQRAWADLGTAHAEEQKTAEIAFRSALADYIDDGVEAAFAMAPASRKHELVDEVPRSFTHEPIRVDYEQAREQFITTDS